MTSNKTFSSYHLRQWSIAFRKTVDKSLTRSGVFVPIAVQIIDLPKTEPEWTIAFTSSSIPEGSACFAAKRLANLVQMIGGEGPKATPTTTRMGRKTLRDVFGVLQVGAMGAGFFQPFAS